MYSSNINEKEKKYIGIFFWIGVAGAAIVLFRFFSMMMFAGDNPLHLNCARVLFQDHAGQIEYPKQALSYPLYHITTKGLAIVLGEQYEIAGAVVLTVCSIFTVIATRYLLTCYVTPKTTFGRLLIDLVSLCSIFFETLKGPLTEGRFYERQGAANPWHNPTIIFVRPFGILTFYLFVILFRKIKNGEKHKKEVILFSVLSVVTVLAKPSFPIVLMPAAGILVLLYWSRGWKENFYAAMEMLLAVAPTLLIAVVQLVYNTGDTIMSVQLAFGSFSGFSFGQVMCASIATFAVPIAVFLVCDWKTLLKDDYLQLAYMTLLFGWIEMFTLTNGPSGDFGWGYYLSVGLSTVMAIGYVLKQYNRKWQMYFVLVIFFVQTVVGFRYLYLIKEFGGYYWF